ncbi:ShlB/FhaC/HecB family hemolysin secretion/activation protein [Variovorax sp. CY25R-8]|uniref:ShlB/FhaC/HecB family hemolysin secretion/activation protein n=1 Tax=Variovorax sp. CY25R-8 TaxID=2855501 RepID=UPI0021BAAE88|nr:ShlB/FhaC/HecB family hemolysin secretion/activation protein [Variovorax sp. CY25R-8]MCT8174985.1 ShlB/FhaC/HecB family hemolysin secretion/activation protein [Variovorax sp. CY25R-8]
MRVLQRSTPIALAVSALFGAALLVAAQRAHATEAEKTALLPTQDPCGSCNRPIAQATGGVAPQTLPAPSRNASATGAFKLNDLRLNGVKALSNEELQSITTPYIGRDVTLADLEELAKAITARYKERGYFLAQAVVPVQTVRDGIVEISVIEGRLGRVDVLVAPEAPIAEARVRGFLAPLQPGEAVNAPAYERAMLLLSDQPGVKVSSALQEGTQPGTTDLSVEVAAAPRWAFTAEGDNHGTKESGRYRLGGTVRWLSPFGIGDNLDARVMVSDSNALQYGRIAYEAPIGTSGLRAGMGLARVSYDLGGQFSDLDAQGRADVLDFSLNYPLIRQRQQNLFLRLTADFKDLRDEIRAVDYDVKKRVRGIGLGWTWERRDEVLGGGYWASTGTLYHGSLSIRDPQTLAADQAFGGRQTEGGFTKMSFQLSRLQSIVPRHSLYLSIGGQWASKNLDASEKLALGGARAVRAYPSGELLADQGVIGTVEWRWSVNEELTPFVFYDAARGKLARHPSPFDGENSRSLRGYGIGLSWSRPGNFSINATLAWRDGTPRAQTDGGGHNPRLYVQVQKAF